MNYNYNISVIINLILNIYNQHYNILNIYNQHDYILKISVLNKLLQLDLLQNHIKILLINVLNNTLSTVKIEDITLISKQLTSENIGNNILISYHNTIIFNYCINLKYNKTDNVVISTLLRWIKNYKILKYERMIKNIQRFNMSFCLDLIKLGGRDSREGKVDSLRIVKFLKDN